MKYLTYKGQKVAVGTELATAIEAKDTKKAEHLHDKLDREFMKYWVGYEHLLNFKIGDQPAVNK